ncbi:hypothetical protein BJ944DRAFT_83015 [Cunninghamella echinulata]|nr:hypothetical protein BJ944DRAFT_83015 [Cunninghamella echinulata]
MKSSLRSKSQDEDEDLELLQQKFFETNQPPSATVIRKAPPSFSSSSSNKKQSLFAQRRAAAAATAAATPTKTKTILDLAQEPNTLKSDMPTLESSTISHNESTTMPSLETSTMPLLESVDTALSEETVEKNSIDNREYEPVMDPHPEPYTPATKKILDLTSMLGSVLGQVKEHTVENVTAPTLPIQQQGFPQPKHRSIFKQTRMKPSTPAIKENNDSKNKDDNEVAFTTSLTNGIEEENNQRIATMSEEEISNAREEILGTLSQESIAFLQKLKNNKGLTLSKEQQHKKDNDNNVITTKTTTTANTNTNTNTNTNANANANANTNTTQHITKEDNDDDDDNDLLKMKEKYFANVPLENDKLAWMDDRFKTPNNSNSTKNEITEDEVKMDPIYRQLRFDLHGKVVDQNDLAKKQQQELHHHGDQPDLAGYTLAELFYLVRSQVPSQRALVLNCLSKILETAKKDKTDPQNQSILHVFHRRDVAATLYIRSALDDRHLIVIISAIKALLSLVTVDTDDDSGAHEMNLLNNDIYNNNLMKFNTLLGHIAQPSYQLNYPTTTTKEWVKQFKDNNNTTEANDAELAEKDIMEALLKMDLLARFHYLMATDSELRASEKSMNQLIEILTILAKTKGMTVCEDIMESNVLELALTLIDDTTASSSSLQRLYVLRLLFTVVQGSKKAALTLKDKITTLILPWLAISPVNHQEFQVQIECIKILRILSCYGIVLPTLQDLQDIIMEWLRVTLNDISTGKNDTMVSSDYSDRAATVIYVLEALLHAAADPHRTVPAHAIDWHQPTAYLPLITLLLKQIEASASSLTSTHSIMLHGSCLSYISTWMSYIEKFPHDIDKPIQEIWSILQPKTTTQINNHKERSSHWILRYMQVWYYFMNIDKLKIFNSTPTSTLPGLNPAKIHEEATIYFKSLYDLVLSATKQNDVYGRMVFYLWYKTTADDTDMSRNSNNNNKLLCFENDVMVGTLVSSLYAGVVETWLTQELVQLCVLSHLNDKLTDTLQPFYMKDMNQEAIETSKALMDINGKDITTLCYPIDKNTNHSLSFSSLPSSDLISIWLLSPIDELFYWDKSHVTQHFILLQQQQQKPHGSSSTSNNNKDDAQEEEQQMLIKTTTIDIVVKTLQAIWELYQDQINHSLLLVTLMKLFLIGDREGQSVQIDIKWVGTEIFWDESVSKWILCWLDKIEKSNSNIGLTKLEKAWQQSSQHIRKAHASFYQFYQSFLSQYASVSFGYPTYSRLLAFVAAQLMDQVDYKHLLLSDYHDIKIGLERQGYQLENKK